MSSRPEILFPLFTSVEALPGIGPKSAKALARMGIETRRDLLLTLPLSVVDRSPVESLTDVTPPTTATVCAEVLRHHPPARRGRPYRIEMRDAGTTFWVVFFRAQGAWLKEQLPEGTRRIISGKVEVFDNTLQMPHPDYVLPEAQRDSIPRFEPIYPQTEGLTTRQIARFVEAALTDLPELPEWLRPEHLARDGWSDWSGALQDAHHPTAVPEFAYPARRRLAYDEMVAHQLMLVLARRGVRRGAGVETRGDGQLRSKVLRALPYQPTGAQSRAIAQITQDMASTQRMNRLLQGDVGAGKTLVALMSLLAAVEAGGQGVLMAPTEILARQHLAGLQPLADAAGVRLALLTGRDQGSERRALLAAVAAGEVEILVGTHALFQDDVVFHDLRLAVVDEQHRFGVAQRMALGAKGAAVDVLVMTATPIPRSLALAQFGDMDISVLDEKPPGRQPISTAMVSAARLDEVVAHLERAVADGKQAYWVCPLVAESELSESTAAESRFKMLRARLGAGVVELVHGQMPAAEKDAAMARFVAGEARVLVATTVIEVGVDVPAATIMVIEEAERFGLAQLHQLRGRVGRGSGASTCLLLYRPPLGETAQRRLEILRETEDGFRIAQEDLEMRGAGDVLGTAQSGLPKFRIADLERDAGWMAMARDEAHYLLEIDPDLKSPRGQAAQVLLWLMQQDRAVQLLSVG